MHGFPTSSIDWYDVVGPLAERFHVSLLDFPGYGFSDKPWNWQYSLASDAELLRHHLLEVLDVDRCSILAHDRGDSVVLLLHHLASLDAGEPAFTLEHLVLTNGNIFLPLSNLTDFQKMALGPSSANAVLEVLTPDALAEGLGTTTFTPPRGPDDPTVAALATTFSFDDGISVLHQTIQYLRERAEHEVTWLHSLATSPTPTTIVWGMCDTVSPVRVGFYVWEHYLRTKPGSNELWLIPGANHYLQNDRPDAFIDVVVASLERTGPQAPGPVSDAPGAPVRVDHSSPRLPAATDTFVL